jgi:hypothetical protein
LALPYPAGTTFQVYVNSTWGTYWSRTVTQVSSPAEVWNGNGYQWHFDGKHLYLRLDNLPANKANSFQRDGAYCLPIEDPQHYQITATCPPSTITADGFCTIADNWPAPSAYWTSVP